jgi:hypothetical protein
VVRGRVRVRATARATARARARAEARVRTRVRVRVVRVSEGFNDQAPTGGSRRGLVNCDGSAPTHVVPGHRAESS